jgi:hypothetical protein
MKHQGKDGFVLRSTDVANDILIPRYYDPRIAEDLHSLSADFDLIELGEFVRAGHVEHNHGDYVPKIFYGTGPYPYVRTSDLANCEIKASPKHGVPKFVYDEYAAGQNVNPGDVLFVHEGTYLIGTVAIVTEFDGPMLYQHHIAKFSVRPSAPFNAYYLLAAFESPIVQRQIRAKQFSADIIDSVVGRLEEVVLPIPKDKARLRAIQLKTENAILGRAKLRERIALAAENVDQWLQGRDRRTLSQLFIAEPDPAAYRHPAFLGGRRGASTTMLEARDIRNDVLLPKYYDPWVGEALPAFRARCDIRTLGDLVHDRILTLQTGDEIGRLNYGTGTIPFVRTSDFGSWELKRESKQGVSEDVWQIWNSSQDAQAGDILLVRDGTYLVGTSVLIDKCDLPLLYCGGIYRIRSVNEELLPPGLLFALLNTPFVQRQIRNKQFTRDVIDTLGQRVLELLLPIPREMSVRAAIDNFFRANLSKRSLLSVELDETTKTLAPVAVQDR